MFSFLFILFYFILFLFFVINNLKCYKDLLEYYSFLYVKYYEVLWC
jgi:hypothetical protein